MNPKCVFCRIIAGTEPASILYQDEDVIAFHDTNPQAPFHALVIPRQHIRMLNDIEPAQALVLGKLFLVAKQIAHEAGYQESGFRVAMNCGRDAGQTVFHIHLHVLAGRFLSWPPG